jgi:hypothetical protein
MSRLFVLIALATACLLSSFALLGSERKKPVAGVVLYSSRDMNVASVVRDLERDGVYVTDKPLKLRARALLGLDLIVVTRSALPATSDTFVGRAYADGALIAGLDMSRRDIEILIFGSSFRPEAPRDPSEPYLTMLSGGCSGTGSFSDRISNWQAARLIRYRAEDAALRCLRIAENK